MQKIAHTLKTLMKENKLTMQALSDKSGVPFASIKSIIQGRSQSPRAHTLEALASAFECQIEELITGNILEKKPTFVISATPDLNKMELFKQAIIIFDEMALKNDISFENNQDARDRCINQLFEFAVEKSKELNETAKIDRSFAQWLISNSLRE